MIRGNPESASIEFEGSSLQAAQSVAKRSYEAGFMPAEDMIVLAGFLDSRHDAEPVAPSRDKVGLAAAEILLSRSQELRASYETPSPSEAASGKLSPKRLGAKVLRLLSPTYGHAKYIEGALPGALEEAAPPLDDIQEEAESEAIVNVSQLEKRELSIDPFATDARRRKRLNNQSVHPKAQVY